MGTDAEQIVAKLTERELDYLEDTFRINLRGTDSVKVLEDLRDTRRRIRAIEEKAMRKRREENGERPTCSFCAGAPETAGMLCQSSLGPVASVGLVLKLSLDDLVQRVNVTPNKRSGERAWISAGAEFSTQMPPKPLLRIALESHRDLRGSAADSQRAAGVRGRPGSEARRAGLARYLAQALAPG